MPTDDQVKLLKGIIADRSGSGLVGGRGKGGELPKSVINLALIMGGLRSLGAQPAGQNFASNLATGISEGVQLGTALQPKAPLFPPSESAFRTGVGTAGAAFYQASTQKANEAAHLLETYEVLQNLAKSFNPDDTGTFATVKLQLGKISDLFGFRSPENVNLANREVFLKYTGELAIAGLANFKGAISDKELEFVKNIAVNLNDTKHAIDLTLALGRKHAQIDILKKEADDVMVQAGGNLIEPVSVPLKGGGSASVGRFAFHNSYIKDQKFEVFDKEIADIIRKAGGAVGNPSSYVPQKDINGNDVYVFYDADKQIVDFLSMTKDEYNEFFRINNE
jgi:hypothetical protein